MSYNQDPMKASPVPSYNANTKDQRLGFALRDKRTTEAISTPMVIPKLGKSYQTFMSHYPTPVVGVSREYMATWTREAANLTTVPGIFTLDFEPVLALSDPNMRSETSDIFTNMWTKMRIVNNMTEKFQPQDIQIIYSALMYIKLHLANIRRILNIMKTVINHELNDYYYGAAMVKALGFDITELDMRQNWENWWQYYNVSLLGNLSSVRWLTDLVPGVDRWAGMVKEVYKDNPAYTDYVQMYMFRPRYFTNIYARWSEEQQAYLWTFDDEAYMQPDLTNPTNGVAAFEAYLEKTFTLIRDIFYDDSTATIIATLNSIVERRMGDSVHTEFLKMEPLPWEGEPVPLVYDFDMLIAIHNATIVPNVTVHAPVQDIQRGALEQNVTIPTTSEGRKGLEIQLFPKVINLPNFGLGTTDMINATQWTVTNQPYGLSSEVVYLRPGSCGTEIISRANMWTYRYNQVTNTYTLDSQRFYQTVDLNTSSEYFSSNIMEGIQMLRMSEAFAFAPMMYFINSTGAAFDTPGTVEHVTGQLEVQYVGDYGVLSQIHKQFVRNFWGYPFDSPESGTFSTSFNAGNSGASSSFKSETRE